MSYGEGEGYDMPGPSFLSRPEHPPGLCITLTQRELEKLDLEEPENTGDVIHMNVMARVKRITKDNGSCTVECQITDVMVLENESTEGDAEDDGD